VSQYGAKNHLAPKLWLTGGVYYGTKFRAFAEKAYSVDRCARVLFSRAVFFLLFQWPIARAVLARLRTCKRR
jgi:hypothetical protein